MLQVVEGPTLGSIYSLVAFGLTLIHSIVHVPDVAHGAFHMVGPFATFHLMTA